jgi:hypothetical protein
LSFSTSDYDAIVTAGALRETLVALGNLERLLKSPLIGERELLPILQEIRETGSRSRTETRAALGGEDVERGSVVKKAFLSDVDRHFEEVGRLLTVGRGGLGARSRLNIERGIVSLTRSTEALLFHLRLLGENGVPSRLPLEVAEVFDVGSSPKWTEGRFVSGSLYLDNPSFSWPVSPEVLRGAVAGLVAHLGIETPALELETRPDGATLRLRPEKSNELGEAHPIQLERTVPLASTPAVVRDVLSRYSIELRQEATELEFTRATA